jgi:DNA-binding transcriptional LysR family regulator
MGVELRHLRYFVAVAETLNYRRAAERLHVSQPALSKQIKDLESDLRAQLFMRNTGGVVLTPAGATFLDDARDLLERVELAAEAARAAEAGRGGRLAVGSLGGVSAGFLAPALAVFRARFPKVEVALHEAPISDQLQALRAGLIQVAFATSPATAVPSKLDSAEVFASRVAVAMARGHRLASQPFITLAELADESLVGVSDKGQTGHQYWMEGIFAGRGIGHRPIKSVNGLESLMALVAGGHGVSMLLPFMRARGEKTIVYRRIKETGDDLVVHLMAVWRKGGGSQVAENFVGVLRTCAAKQRRV